MKPKFILLRINAIYAVSAFFNLGVFVPECVAAGKVKFKADSTKALVVENLSGSFGQVVGIYANAESPYTPYGIWGRATTNANEAEGMHAEGIVGASATVVDGLEAVAYGANPPSEENQEVHGIDVIARYGARAYGISAYAEYATDTSQLWAGYFSSYKGVFIEGNCHPCFPSDEKFKTNINSLGDGIKIIMALKPRTYNMKREEFKKQIHLPSGLQYGFVAQEVEPVLPELVHTVVAPNSKPSLMEEKVTKAPKTEPLSFKGIEYTSLIPILVRAIQQQQAEIEALKKGK